MLWSCFTCRWYNKNDFVCMCSVWVHLCVCLLVHLKHAYWIITIWGGLCSHSLRWSGRQRLIQVSIKCTSPILTQTNATQWDEVEEEQCFVQICIQLLSWHPSKQVHSLIQTQTYATHRWSGRAAPNLINYQKKTTYGVHSDHTDAPRWSGRAAELCPDLHPTLLLTAPCCLPAAWHRWTWR